MRRTTTSISRWITGISSVCTATRSPRTAWTATAATSVDVQRLRAEAHVLKAYYYFELAKRYGGVPLIDRVYADQKEANLPRGTFDEVVGLILREIEGVRNELVVDWRAENLEEKSGRITRGAALALKSRVLLYAASRVNPSGESPSGLPAAAAAFEVINMGIYSLHPDYGGLFVAETSTTSPETIWAVRIGATNEFERKNYPIGTQGGGTWVSALRRTSWKPMNPRGRIRTMPMPASTRASTPPSCATAIRGTGARSKSMRAAPTDPAQGDRLAHGVLPAQVPEREPEPHQ